jgi:hypothetical protein
MDKSEKYGIMRSVKVALEAGRLSTINCPVWPHQGLTGFFIGPMNLADR